MISTNLCAPTKGYLENYAQGRDNNFTLLRFVAATAVLVTHSFVLSTGNAETEPLVGKLGISLGTIAVHVFFAASGFLVTGSLLFRKNLREFIIARALRIFPGLWVALAVTVVAVGLFFTTFSIGSYFVNPKLWEYLARNGSLLAFGRSLPGAFTAVPWRDSVNGSLWTLPFEVRMYAILAGIWALGVLFKLNAPRLLSIACVFLAVGTVFYDVISFLLGTPNVLLSLVGMFFYGASLRVLQKRIWISHSISVSIFALLLISAFVDRTIFGVIYRLSLPYLTIYFAFVPSGFIRKFNIFGDYSYGIYIYAFPVQQALAHIFQGIQPVGMIFGSFAITLLLAVASWHLIELRALGLKERIAGKFTRASSDVRHSRPGYEQSR